MQRAQRIARNKLVMEKLALRSLADSFTASLQPRKPCLKKQTQAVKRSSSKPSNTEHAPKRRSVRQRGMPPSKPPIPGSDKEQDTIDAAQVKGTAFGLSRLQVRNGLTRHRA